MRQPGISHFGKTSDGRPVQVATLSEGELTASFLSWGAVIQSVRLRGVPYDLTLGSENIADYQGPMQYHGSLIGPVANRITGATAQIGGVTYDFDKNLNDALTLHSGSAGTQTKIWRLVEITENTAAFALELPDGEGGFPGNRRVLARFSLHPHAVMRMEVTVNTDKPTILNLANHSYWNLDGTPDWSGHQLQINSDRYLPTNADFAPTGEVIAVAGTDKDYRTPRQISPDTDPFDNNFCLSDTRRPLTDALVLTGSSGVTMTVATTETGIQVYDGRNAIRPGQAAYEGLAIEAQSWPDATNHSHFPSVVLQPEETYHQITEWRFSQS